MRTHLELFLIFILLLSSLIGEQNYEDLDLINDSQYWPYRISLLDNIKTDDGRIIKQNTVGVVIRVEELDKQAFVVVDFGDKGIQFVEAAKTDIKSAISRIKTKQQDKWGSNYVQMLANKFSIVEEESFYKLSLDDFSTRQGFLFVYLSSKTSIEGLAADYKQYAAELSEAGLVPILFPLFSVNDVELVKTMREHTLCLGVFPGYLSGPYRDTLHHQSEGRDLIVITDLEGKILCRTLGLEFKHCLENLEDIR